METAENRQNGGEGHELGVSVQRGSVGANFSL